MDFIIDPENKINKVHVNRWVHNGLENAVIKMDLILVGDFYNCVE